MIGTIVRVVSIHAEKEGFSGVGQEDQHGWKFRFFSDAPLALGEHAEIRDFWTKEAEGSFIEFDVWHVRKTKKSKDNAAATEQATSVATLPTAATQENTITFHGPIMVKPGTCQADIPPGLGELAGVYLWAVEFDNGYLVNYVGKTVRYASRFDQYKRWMEAGRDIIDPDYMPRGENWRVDSPTPDQILRCAATYRFFFGPIDVQDDVLLRIENALIHAFLDAGGSIAAFLGNKQKRVMKKEGRQLSLNSAAAIHGLNAITTI